MELPKKPELSYEETNGQYGETVIQLTAESEITWSRYLTELGIARRAVYATANNLGTDTRTEEL